MKYIMNFIGNFFIPLKSRFYYQQIRTKSFCHSNGLRRMYAITTRLITRSSNNTAVRIVSNNNCFPCKIIVIKSFHSSIEAIHVYMYYLTIVLHHI